MKLINNNYSRSVLAAAAIVCAGCSFSPGVKNPDSGSATINLSTSAGNPGMIVRQGDWNAATLFPGGPVEGKTLSKSARAASFSEARVMVLNGLYAQKRLAESGKVDFFRAMVESNATSFAGKELDNWDVLVSSMDGFLQLELVYCGVLSRASDSTVSGEIVVKPGSNFVIVCFQNDAGGIYYVTGATYVYQSSVIKALVPGDTTGYSDGWIATLNRIAGGLVVWESMPYPDSSKTYTLPKIGRIGYSLAHADSLASHFADSVENSSAAHMTMVQIAAKGQSVTLAGVPVLFSRDFLINATEVTEAAFQKVVGVNPSSHVGSSLPVENVSWYDAVRYCNQLSADSGFDQCYDTTAWSCDLSKNGFRLPTEAEWLFAYEAGNPGKYYWGDTMDGRYVWYGLNSNGQTHDVGTRLPNNFGLYDMAGNVWEWCNDWGYSAPTQDTVDWTGPLTGSSRTLRGGQYGNYNNGTQDGTLCFSSTFRYAEPPTNKEPYTGFRCVRSVLK
jgi:hypothetical protein